MYETILGISEKAGVRGCFQVDLLICHGFLIILVLTIWACYCVRTCSLFSAQDKDFNSVVRQYFSECQNISILGLVFIL